MTATPPLSPRTTHRIPPWKLAVKRAIDLTAAVLLLVLLSPLLVAIAVAVKCGSRGPVLFIQERIGEMGKPFHICKFRTMLVGAESMGSGYEVSRDDPRITPVGRWLRRTSFDELPQLWNILKGEMSLVGPRPTLRYQVERYSEEERRRLLVKPGVTGLAQVEGRNAISWAERIRWDLRYIDHYSLQLDAVILARTVKLWITGEGIYGR